MIAVVIVVCLIAFGLMQEVPSGCLIRRWQAAIVAPLTRARLLRTVREEKFRTARAKGFAESLVIAKHAMKNPMIPVAKGTILLCAVFLVPANLAVDVRSAYLDPRIRYD
jgi:ABC-type dipeptide/oligopeptide/nickel transport system permease component